MTVGAALDVADFLRPGFLADLSRLPTFRAANPLRYSAAGKVITAPLPLTHPSFEWSAGTLYQTLGYSWAAPQLALYPDQSAIALSGYSPFEVNDGALDFIADHTPARVLPFLPAGFAREYISGAINSYPACQTYGYFEMLARMPRGPGLWPAFWLLPLDLSWPPEIDIAEVLGADPTTLYTTVHAVVGGSNFQWGLPTSGPDLSAEFHGYGVDWGPDSIDFYLDRLLVHSVPTPPSCHKPAYIVVNLAVGGPTSWGGAPTATTKFPARMSVEYVKVWQRHAYAAQAAISAAGF